MIDLHFISFHWSYILILLIGALVGMLGMVLAAIGPRYEYDKQHLKDRKRIEDQTKIIFEMRKELVEAKGAASSNELRANCLEQLKNDLQADYDLYKKSYLDFVLDYKNLYIALDTIKAAEARKFPSPEEIVNEMLEDHKLKVSLAS